MQNQAVPSSKPRITTYPTPEIKAQFDAIADDQGKSASEAALEAIEAWIDPEQISVKIPPKLRKKIEADARQNFRTFEAEIILLLGQKLGFSTDELLEMLHPPSQAERQE